MDLSNKKNADISRNKTAMAGMYIMNVVLAVVVLGVLGAVFGLILAIAS